jgi:S-DNA-T family DNA segregation ATPase FtsK/SpoIIIE
MEQATASSIKAKYIRGRTVKLTMGCIPVYESMEYGEHLIKDGTISIPYYTPFGIKYLDFHDEATCHMIVAGATRMGKTVFIRLLFTNILKSTGGKVRFFYVNNKVEDYFPFIGIPQIPEPAETIGEAIAMMYQVRGEIMRRKSILRSKRDCVNVKQFNKKYPNEYIEPMFVVFDEYGRFIDDSDESQELQDLILEVSETAGYLDIHLVIATQRPDATTVLKPRIRANILSRVCFQTADEANSKIVVHSDDAFNLGEVAGRAIVLDGMRSVAQIPYISEEDTMDLLHEFRGNRYENKPERQPDNHVIEEVQSVEPRSDSSDSMPGSETPTCDSEPYYEEIKPRKSRSRGKKTKG